MIRDSILVGSAQAVNEAWAARASWAPTSLRVRGVVLIGPGEAPPPLIARAPVWDALDLSKAKASSLILIEPPADGAAKRSVLARAAEGGLRCFLLAEGKLRRLRLDDLIGRPLGDVDFARIRDTVAGKRVLITGGGGSIGGELCRQILRYKPAHVIVLGHGENSVFEITNELQRICKEWQGQPANSTAEPAFCKITPVIADLRFAERLVTICEEYRPEIIFHAAAHKHVPLMETNHLQAIDTNILGTSHLILAADKYAATLPPGETVRIVNISTDKAVAPENIMGITKRIAELLMYNLARLGSGRLRTVSVRFGNVLGSSGSVVPLFWEQIQQGGPLTVTHPDMERFFMTIPEAVRLVLQAAALRDESDGILALDMGKPVRIVELAERLILLAGKKPHSEVPIVFTGIRPGEKLKEELFWEKDSVQTAIPFIFKSTSDVKTVDIGHFLQLLKSALEENRSRSWYREFLLKYA